MNTIKNKKHRLDNKWELARLHFPILSQYVNDHPLIYLDNAATMQVPTCVLDAIKNHYLGRNGNVHRATHELSNLSTNALEQARESVANFLGAPTSNSVIFTRGTTDSLNMLCASIAQKQGSKFSALVSALEHHSNFVPWQQSAKRVQGFFSVIPLNLHGDIDVNAYIKLLETQPAGVVSIAHVSNVLGTLNPVSELIKLAHERGWLVSIDAAQSIRHERINVAELDCDFLSFSGHKVMGPTGIGVLYIKEQLLDELPPVCFGGEMVDTVRTAETTFEAAPLRFEAGTPNYVGAIALAVALEFLERLGRDDVHNREHNLLSLAEKRLSPIDGVRILGSPQKRAGVLSFSVDGIHPFDIATLMDKMGVAVRAGSQCAQPLLHEVFSLDSVVRISPAFYNTPDEIEAAGEALERAIALCKNHNKRVVD